jgi:hypothetical protein
MLPFCFFVVGYYEKDLSNKEARLANNFRDLESQIATQVT